MPSSPPSPRAGRLREPAAGNVDLTDLEIIRRYSLAVRQDSADRAEVLDLLRADLERLEGRLTAATTPVRPNPAKRSTAKRTPTRPAPRG